MKKPLLLVALPAIALGMLLASGCSMFRSHKAWDTARQESPLEIPPGLDRPTTSAALVVPPSAAEQPGSAERHAEPAADGQVSDGFVLKDAVDSTYQRVGRVLEHGDLGRVVGHDDAAHSYTLNVAAMAVPQKKLGLFKRLLHWGKRDTPEASAGATNQVVVSIASNGADVTEVRALGDGAAVRKIIDGLKSRLGG
ncbi:MAG: hypothetical protein ABI379_03140 [Rhodanobacter sp.]